jgi:hypothetical protein
MGKSRDEMQQAGREIERAATDRAIEVGGVSVSVIPMIGGPVSAVLGGMAQQRKLDRVKEVLEGLSADLRDFKSTVSDEYVKTEDFEDLLEKTLRTAAEERNAEVRALYRQFLFRAITEPGDPYEGQVAVLRVIEGMDPQHLAVLRATLQEPGRDAHQKYMGSPIQTLRERTGFDDATIGAVVAELDNKALTKFQGLRTMMTGHGSEALTHNVTPLGRRVLEYVGAE